MTSSATPADTGIYTSASAKDYIHTSTSDQPQDPALVTLPTTDPLKIKSYHHSLPNFTATPLHSLPSIASTLGINALLLKTESSRLGLPAFKILGASWGVYRALCEYLSIQNPDPEVFGIEQLKTEIRKRKERIVLFAATDGNHGRAVARMAKLLLSSPPSNGVEEEDKNAEDPSCEIYVPGGMYETTKKLIGGEGARVVTVQGDYDKAVLECWEASKQIPGGGGVMVQDNAFAGYEIVPRWIVEGYATLLQEVDEQFNELVKAGDAADHDKHITHVVTPIGVGSLGHAVVKWAKDANRANRVRVITVEPETAACLNVSLRKGENTTIETVDTIMSGMCCGTVSPISWETLRKGVDCSITADDWLAHETVLELERHRIEAGPCGAGCLAGLKKVLDSQKLRDELELDRDSVVVVLCTEGKREYPVPERPEARS